MVELPPDLARVGDELTGAARRATARRERRRRIAVVAAIGAASFVAFTPAALGPAQRELTFAEDFAPMACDQPRGAPFALVACDGPMILNRPAAWPSYS
jgi:hypothetical protein